MLAEAHTAVLRQVRQAGLKTPLAGTRIDYPVMPAIAALNPSAEAVLADGVLTLMSALSRIVHAYRSDAELAAFLDVPAPAAEFWITDQPRPAELAIDLCRVDLAGDHRLADMRILEFSPNSPAGTIFSGMIAGWWRDSAVGPLLKQWNSVPAPFEGDTWFADALLDIEAESSGQRDDFPSFPPVLLLGPPDEQPAERDVVARQLWRRGRDLTVAEPIEVRKEESARLCYLKYHLHALLVDGMSWEAVRGLGRAGRLRVINEVAMRLIAGSKLCLAVMSDPRFRHLFSAEQCRVIDWLVPYSRKLGDGIGRRETVRCRDDLVLKSPYGHRGKEVHIGRACAAEHWRALVHDPRHQGWLVQRFVQPGRVQGFNRDLSVVVMNGQISGYSARVNRDLVVNLAQGGAKQTIVSCLPPP
jgi:hypothetical protein